jgi:hypothetical protein
MGLVKIATAIPDAVTRWLIPRARCAQLLARLYTSSMLKM